MAAITLLQIDMTDPRPFAQVEHVPGIPAGANVLPKRYLVVGECKAAYTNKDKVERIFSPGDARTKYGRGNAITRMIETVIGVHARAEIYALPVSELAGGTAASWALAVTGTATESGLIRIIAGGTRYQIGVAKGDTNTTVAQAIKAAVDANPDAPFTAGLAVATVTLTTKWKGASGNGIQVIIEQEEIGGTSIAITPTAGAGVPSMTAGIANLAAIEKGFTNIPTSLSDDGSLDALEDELTRRDDAKVGLDGDIFVGITGTKGQMITWLDSRNSRFTRAIAVGKAQANPWEMAAWMAGLRGVKTYPTITSVNDPFPKRFLPPAEQSDYLLKSDISHLIGAGATALKMAPDESFAVSRFVSTATQDSNGAADPIYFDGMTTEILRVIRYDLSVTCSKVLGRIIVDDDKQNKASNEFPPSALAGLIKTRIIGPLRRYFKNPQKAADSIYIEQSDVNPNGYQAKIDTELVKELLQIGIQHNFT